ncbi:flagellin [Citricoccus sp.]|uniref:flagellin N-terminal helical domain-containing protein n=1 Tax=Citricoccus sp. TaxID=1978372 RepID=UPI0028BEA8A2|nr:flagellin [Citricoccus sp.]
MTVINTNNAANNTYRLMSESSDAAAKNMEKLSSGLRINRAADDAAGLSIAEGLKSQSNGLEVASRNAQDAINMIQTAEGGLSSAHEILQRVRDLAVQAGNDSNNAEARTAIATEINALGDELVRMGNSINFNGTKLLGTPTADAGVDGNRPASLSFQVGANATNDQITVDLDADLVAIGTAIKAFGTDGTTDGGSLITDSGTAAAAITAIDTQISTVSSARSSLGADQNRLEHTIKHVNVAAENLTAAESSIRDVDMAKEMVELSANNIKTQASQAMLAQANQSTQGILQLLR